ncbi:nucleoside-diphosphate sugar epimerase [Bacillus sp. FJAT-27225]|nr:nucleoside-diphosphate sugar epimerase [Bacillus sp. FJAT-27225]
MAKDKIKLTILRPTMIYGDMCDHNMSKFIKMIDKMPIYPLINNGNGLIQPVNARDLGKAYYDVLMNPEATSNNHYNLSGEKPITMKEALRIISIKLGKKTIFLPISLRLSGIAAFLAKVATLGNLDIVEQVHRMGEDRAYEHSAARKDFNYSPMPFEKGIELEIREYQSLKQRKLTER